MPTKQNLHLLFLSNIKHSISKTQETKILDEKSTQTINQNQIFLISIIVLLF